MRALLQSQRLRVDAEVVHVQLRCWLVNRKSRLHGTNLQWMVQDNRYHLSRPNACDESKQVVNPAGAADVLCVQTVQPGSSAAADEAPVAYLRSCW